MADVNEILAKLNRDQHAPPELQRASSLHLPNRSSGQFIFQGQSNPSTMLGSSFQESSQRPASTAFGAAPQISEREANDRTATLLNLLKFNQPAASGSHPAAMEANKPHPPPVNQAFPAQASAAAPKENAQDLLLSLLTRSQAVKDSSIKPSTLLKENELPANEESQVRGTTPVRVFGSVESDKSTPFTAPQGESKSTIFSYVNPFEQLSTSSPYNRTHQSEHTSSEQPIDMLKSKKDRRSNRNGSKTASPAPSPLPDGRTRVEALMGIGASQSRKETVSQALNEIGQQVDQEVQDALASAEQEKRETSHSKLHRTEQVLDSHDLQIAAAEIKEDLKDSEKKALLEKDMPPEMAKAFEDTINEFALDEGGDSWESADGEDSPSKGNAEVPVRVYNFPMRPWVSIDLLDSAATQSPIRQDIIMKVASLKKDFDQIDRNLTTATSNHIVYALAKGGGFRVIRQDDGKNKQAFRKVENQIFTLGISTSQDGANSVPYETILATGGDGSVFWTKVSLPEDGYDAFDHDFDSQGFIFPPLSSGDENTSGAQLKTRAKLSSRHQEFFAVGRGKSIYLVWPGVAMESPYLDRKTQRVHTEKYLADHSVKISTGKAGKDFAFSQDDSCLVSLDKSGRLKFWDIRSLATPIRHEPSPPLENKVPMMMLLTSPVEKSRATSVQFVDKERPTMKGTALRYLLVGHRQNHSLQLWDLGLEKPVQELNFPQMNDTDPICSVAYHPKSAIIAVGHPTRNSIYLIHLSAPRYHLPQMSQAKYMERLAAKDRNLPKPESTAIMSGIREISLTPLGLLRSLDVPSSLNVTVDKAEQDDETLFEAYVMHSKGVACLNFKRQDLGWTRDGKVLHGLDAKEQGVINVKDMVPTAVPPSEHTERSSEQAPAEDTARTEKPPQVSEKIPQSNSVRGEERAVITTAEPTSDPKANAAKTEHKSAPKLAAAGSAKVASYASAAQRSLLSQAGSTQEPRELSASTMKQVSDPPEAKTLTAEAKDNEKLAGKDLSSMGAAISVELTKVVSEQFDGLYRRLDNDKRVQEAAGAAKQDAILRLVSSSLTENVEKSLSRIVSDNIRDSVIPSISNVTASTLDGKLSDTLSQHLRELIPRELQSSLSYAIDQALQNPQVLQNLSELISDRVAMRVESIFASAMNTSIAPAFGQLAADASQRMASEIENRVTVQLRQAEVQRQNDNIKIDELTSLTTELLNTVRTMAGAQSALQDEVLKLQASLGAQPELSAEEPGHARQSSPSEPRDPEADLLEATLGAGGLEDGIIKWLQSARQVELFDKVLIKFSSTLLLELNQLVVLSVTAAITASFDTNVAQRLEWLDVALAGIDPANPDVAEVGPRIMDVLTQRLQEVYMQLSESNPSDPLLGQIHRLVRKTKELKSLAS